MNSMIKRVFLALALVHVSLVSALTARFMIMLFLERVGTGPNYWQFVRLSLQGYRNSFIPILLIGGGIIYAYDKWIKHILAWGSYWVSVTSLSVFYGLLVFFGISVNREFTFPIQTWLLAWAFSLAIYTIFVLIGRLGEGIHEQLAISRVGHFFIDLAIVAFGLLISYIFRFDGWPPNDYPRQFVMLLPYIMLLYVALNFVWRVYTFVWRFTSLKEALVIILSVTSSGLIVLLVRILILERFPALQIPFGILLIHPAITSIGFISVRVLRRIQYNYLLRDKAQGSFPDTEKRVLLIGAGRSGTMLVRDLESCRNFKIVGFLDDDRRKYGSTINGIRVLGTTQDAATIIKGKSVQEVVFCMPSASRSVIRRIAAECATLGIPTSSVPSLSEIILGKVKFSQLRPVRMESLLGRASVEFSSDDYELLNAYSGKRILVTGAAGSIGSELVRQLKEFNPATLLLLDKDENGLFEIGLEICEDYGGEVVQIIANIRDRNRLDQVFQRWKPEVILHAAAYKHVPMMEHNPSESVLNNILGTRNVVKLADEHEVRSFLLISTDKAVNPTNVMGASKRVAEMIVRYTALHGKGTTRFCSVRFGNVLGSRGSVVPLFQKRIAQGKNIHVTHPDIKRYFMTIPEAVQLVIQAGSLGQHGETYVLDMGDPVRIVDLAKDLIEQSGLIPGKDIEIEFTGLRPGEKLFEELMLTAESGVRNTKYPKIFVDRAIEYDWNVLEGALKSFEEVARTEDVKGIYQIFRSLNIGYERKVVPLPADAGNKPTLKNLEPRRPLRPQRKS
jgi:FlaA1/EpsC-like NDP-sugar epimerase